MACDATKLINLMRDRRMFSEWLRSSADERTIHVDVATFAAVDNTQVGNPCLANSTMETADQSTALPLRSNL